MINYGSDYAFLDQLLSLTGGRGVDLAIDGVGARTLANTVKGLARGGTAVSIGWASGPPPAINPLELVGLCTRIAGGSLTSYIADPGELKERAAAVHGCGIILHHEGKAKPLHSGLQDSVLIVEDELPLHAHAKLSAILLKLPLIEAARICPPLVDAPMLGQGLRGMRHAPMF